MTSLPSVLLTGGGTGGHLMPALALCDYAHRQRAFSPTIAHSGRPIEMAILANQHINSLQTPAWTLQLSRDIPGLWQGWKVALATAQEVIDQTNPHCVIGLGGSASLPFVYAAARDLIPTILLEQNLVPGWANQLLWRCASRVCISFDQTAAYFRHHAKCVLTGNPLRQNIIDLALYPAITDRSTKTLLVLGGSQGAQHVNETVAEALGLLKLVSPENLANWHLHHQVGHFKEDAIPRLSAGASRIGLQSTIVPYIDDMTAAYRYASLVITRAGATTLAELACLGLPAIIIPIPDSRRQHQLANARYFSEHGAAALVEQKMSPAQTAGALAPILERLMSDSGQRATMSARMKELSHTTACQNILNVIEQVIRR